MIKDIQVSFSNLKHNQNETQENVKTANGSTHKDVDLFLRLLLETKEKIGGIIVKVYVSFTKDKKKIEFWTSDKISDVKTVFLEFPFYNLEEYFVLSNTEKSEFILKYIVNSF